MLVQMAWDSGSNGDVDGGKGHPGMSRDGVTLDSGFRRTSGDMMLTLSQLYAQW